MNRRNFDVALVKQGIPAYVLAIRLKLSPAMISKWRVLGDVPKKYRNRLCRALKVKQKYLFRK